MAINENLNNNINIAASKANSYNFNTLQSESEKILSIGKKVVDDNISLNSTTEEIMKKRNNLYSEMLSTVAIKYFTNKLKGHVEYGQNIIDAGMRLTINEQTSPLFKLLEKTRFLLDQNNINSKELIECGKDFSALSDIIKKDFNIDKTMEAPVFVYNKVASSAENSENIEALFYNGLNKYEISPFVFNGYQYNGKINYTSVTNLSKSLYYYSNADDTREENRSLSVEIVPDLYSFDGKNKADYIDINLYALRNTILKVNEGTIDFPYVIETGTDFISCLKKWKDSNKNQESPKNVYLYINSNFSVNADEIASVISTPTQVEFEKINITFASNKIITITNAGNQPSIVNMLTEYAKFYRGSEKFGSEITIKLDSNELEPIKKSCPTTDDSKKVSSLFFIEMGTHIALENISFLNESGNRFEYKSTSNSHFIFNGKEDSVSFAGKNFLFYLSEDEATNKQYGTLSLSYTSDDEKETVLISGPSYNTSNLLLKKLDDIVKYLTLLSLLEKSDVWSPDLGVNSLDSYYNENIKGVYFRPSIEEYKNIIGEFIDSLSSFSDEIKDFLNKRVNDINLIASSVIEFESEREGKDPIYSKEYIKILLDGYNTILALINLSNDETLESTETLAEPNVEDVPKIGETENTRKMLRNLTKTNSEIKKYNSLHRISLRNKSINTNASDRLTTVIPVNNLELVDEKDLFSAIEIVFSKILSLTDTILEELYDAILELNKLIEQYLILFPPISSVSAELRNSLSYFQTARLNLPRQCIFPNSIKSYEEWEEYIDRYNNDGVYNLVLLYIAIELGFNLNGYSVFDIDDAIDKKVFRKIYNNVLLNGADSKLWYKKYFSEEIMIALNNKRDLYETFKLLITDDVNKEFLAPSLTLYLPELSTFENVDLSEYLSFINDEETEIEETYTRFENAISLVFIKKIFKSQSPMSVIDKIENIFTSSAINFKMLLMHNIFYKTLKTIFNSIIGNLELNVDATLINSAFEIDVDFSSNSTNFSKIKSVNKGSGIYELSYDTTLVLTVNTLTPETDKDGKAISPVTAKWESDNYKTIVLSEQESQLDTKIELITNFEEKSILDILSLNEIFSLASDSTLYETLGTYRYVWGILYSPNFSILNSKYIDQQMLDDLLGIRSSYSNPNIVTDFNNFKTEKESNIGLKIFESYLFNAQNNLR